jgi:uncharacterized protein YndB with AHSA1/START domain
MSTTRVNQHVNAPRERVYRALLDADAVQAWRVPAGMTSEVHTFEPWEGGAVRISLTYEEPTRTGKTTAHTDTYHGRFVKLVPNEQVVETVEFETGDMAMQGEMTIAITLADADGGTDVGAVHDGVPPGVRPKTTRPGGGTRWGSWRRSSRRARFPVATPQPLAHRGGRGVGVWVVGPRVIPSATASRSRRCRC